MVFNIEGDGIGLLLCLVHVLTSPEPNWLQMAGPADSTHGCEHSGAFRGNLRQHTRTINGKIIYCINEGLQNCKDSEQM